MTVEQLSIVLAYNRGTVLINYYLHRRPSVFNHVICHSITNIGRHVVRPERSLRHR